MFFWGSVVNERTLYTRNLGRIHSSRKHQSRRHETSRLTATDSEVRIPFHYQTADLIQRHLFDLIQMFNTFLYYPYHCIRTTALFARLVSNRWKPLAKCNQNIIENIYGIIILTLYMADCKLELACV